MKLCKFPDCTNTTEHGGRGWCGTHWLRWRKYGDPAVVHQSGRRREDPWVRFDKYTEALPTGCWLWTGPTNNQGYGELWTGEKLVGAHRWSYEQFIGDLPQEVTMGLDHTCHTKGCKEGGPCQHRACVNPLHLKPLTKVENTKRGKSGQHQASRTHCPEGHEYTPENTMLVKQSGGRPGFYRRCRECHRARQEVRNRAHAEAS